jgi:hypothetical protein
MVIVLKNDFALLDLSGFWPIHRLTEGGAKVSTGLGAPHQRE